MSNHPTTIIPITQPVAEALLLFTERRSSCSLDAAALRVDAHGAQWEATDGISLIIFRPNEQPDLEHGVYITTAEALARCAGIPRKYRIATDDAVAVEPTTCWPDTLAACPLLTGRATAPVTLAGPLLARLDAVGKLLGPRRDRGWHVHAGDDLRHPVVCLPDWTPEPAGRLMVILMPLRTSVTGQHRTPDGWMEPPLTP